jgi:adenylylsulfate kinase
VQPSQQPAAFGVWITGLPASGKSTVAAALAQRLREAGIPFVVLESDAMRKVYPVPPVYDERDREYFYGSLAFIGQMLTEHGISVIFDATANRRSYRDQARRRIARFIEVFVDCPLNVCIARDPKGIYLKAREGKASHVPGIQAVYEPPEKPEIIVHGDQDSPEEAARRIFALVEGGGESRNGG